MGGIVPGQHHAMFLDLHDLKAVVNYIFERRFRTEQSSMCLCDQGL